MEKTVNLKMPGVIELDVEELKEVDGGGEVPWWYYFVAPGTAYIVDKFLDGYERGLKSDD
jgi:hypothetical protein